jgi:hypothetical protein
MYRFVAFNIAYHKNFVSNFFETLKYKFHIFKNKRLRVARSTLVHSHLHTDLKIKSAMDS